MNTLAARAQEFSRALELSAGVIDPAELPSLRAVAARAQERSRLSAEHTVVALAGATGTGKSSLFNRIVGVDAARTSAQRPTTERPLAAVAETAQLADGSRELLNWLGVQERHELEVGRRRPDGLVLLDLPDHDSVVVDHRARADHVTERADVLVWVTNPQKYADGLLHTHYLSESLHPEGTVIVALNQIDRLTAQERTAVTDDLSRLLEQEGVTAQVLAISALTGEGVPELERQITRAVLHRETATAAIVNQVRASAHHLLELLPPAGETRRSLGGAREELTTALSVAAGVPLVVSAVRDATRRDAALKTGWPALRWVSRLRADPLRTLGLRAPTHRASEVEHELQRSSVPSASPSSRAAVQSATREYIGRASTALGERGSERLSETVVTDSGALIEAVDAHIVRSVPRRSARWWTVVSVLQWLLFAGAVTGGLWLLGLFVLDLLRIPSDTFTVPIDLGVPVPLPTLLLIGGVGAGLLVAGVARLAARATAARFARRTERELRRGIEQVAAAAVFAPVDHELATIAAAREAATAAAE